LSQRRMSEVPEPDFERMWQNIENKLDSVEEIARKPFPIRILAIACSLSLIIVAAALYNPVDARALGERVVTTLKSIVSGTLINERIGFTSKDEQLPDKSSVNQNDMYMTIDKIISQATFNVEIPGYLPPDYKLKDAQLASVTSKLSKVTLKYSNGLHVIIVTEKNVPDDYGQSILYDNEDMLREEIEINSQDYIVLTHKSGWTEVVWFKKGILFKMESKLPKKQAMNVASSFKKAGK